MGLSFLAPKSRFANQEFEIAKKFILVRKGNFFSDIEKKSKWLRSQFLRPCFRKLRENAPVFEIEVSLIKKLSTLGDFTKLPKSVGVWCSQPSQSVRSFRTLFDPSGQILSPN